MKVYFGWEMIIIDQISDLTEEIIFPIKYC